MRKITIQSEVSLEDDVAGQLADILDCSIADLGDELAGYSTAALTEYIEMFIGRKVFTRGSDFREYRLFLLSKHLPEIFSEEQKVSDLFQTTHSQSRKLIQAVTAKYQYEVRPTVVEDLKRILEDASVNGSTWLLSVPSRAMVDLMNQSLARIDPSLPPIESKRGTTGQFTVPTSSFRALRKDLGLPRHPGDPKKQRGKS